MKRVLLSLPTLLGLLMIDQLTIILLSSYTEKNYFLTPLEIVTVLVVSLLSVLYFLYWGKKQEYAEWSIKNFWLNKGKIILGFLVILAVLMIYNAIMVAIKQVTVSANQQALKGLQKHAPFLLMWFVVAVCGPIMEETIFRLAIFKLVFPQKDKIALLVSTLLFAFAHMQSEVTNLLAWPPYLMMGFILGYLFYRTKKIEVSVAVHGIWNTLAVVIQYLM
ncbi:MAG: CPBP family intramembrane metalloprotease [Streptococcaceae bacterium]|jgi:membrane protease YdiL (CAAX protease family)|nr:CPBP family intramembrane metalloprotease [Streptococcaceae bacterium]